MRHFVHFIWQDTWDNLRAKGWANLVLIIVFVLRSRLMLALMTIWQIGDFYETGTVITHTHRCKQPARGKLAKNGKESRKQTYIDASLWRFPCQLKHYMLMEQKKASLNKTMKDVCYELDSLISVTYKFVSRRCHT